MSDRDSRSTSSSEDPLREDSEGWDDVEADEEDIQVKDFFSDRVFPSAQSMLQYCAQDHALDFVKIQKDLVLDFYDSIRLVNYLRTEIGNGNTKPDVSQKSLFENDKYLQPALPDDALLFCLDDLTPEEGIEPVADSKVTGGGSSETANQLREQLAALQSQFNSYKAAVGKTLDERWQANDDASISKDLEERERLRKQAQEEKNDAADDKGYFEAYSYNDIHQTMLQDTVRTDAYRDFIYENKHLFAGKTVLDVGCGTGILSMFCAKAGAAKVISVDNSAIIEKAQSIIALNGLSNVVTCVRGKIEEISLPSGIEKVDIIVSEWMGYCLLFEAMLDSVLYARDKYLKPDGLMVPSHCTFHLAALEDPEYVEDNFSFWSDVYGFDMTPMTEKIYDDAIVRYPKREAVAGQTKDLQPFKVLDLHTITTKELEFEASYVVKLDRDVDKLDGFCIWFDAIFMPSRDKPVPEDTLRGLKAKDALQRTVQTLSTSPLSPETHWRCAVFMIDSSKTLKSEQKAGDEIAGTLSMHKSKDMKRGLNIKFQWQSNGRSDKQRWYLL